MSYKEPEYKDPKSVNKPLFPETGSQLQCPKCNHHIIADNININKAIAKCNNCNNVFSFEEEIKTSSRKRPEIFLPEEIEILSLTNELNIHYKWRKAKSIHPFLVFFGLLWNAMIIPFVIVAVASGNFGMLLGLSIHFAVGIGFLVHIFTRLINTTYITVDDYELSIEHRPISIPFLMKDYHVDSREIKQLYSKKLVATKSENGDYKTYEFAVIAQLRSGEEIKIISGLKSKHKALFIEQEIELFLGIEDKPVEDEVP